MYGGDEVGSLVFDIGSFNARFGYSGEDAPRYVFQSQVGVTTTHSSSEDILMKNTDDCKYFFGENELRYYKPNIKINSPMNSNGYIERLDLFEALIGNVYNKCFKTEPKEHPLLFSEPVIHNKDHRLSLAQLMFETFEIPAMFITKTPVLSAFSCGRSTCLVFDSGHNHSTATPVNDGYALQKSLIRVNVAGDYVNNELSQILKMKGTNITPHYKFTKQKTSEDIFETVYFPQNEVQADPSYESFWINEIIREMKESTLTVSEELMTSKDVIIKPSQYELPDGTNVDLREEKISILEKLFNAKKEIPGFFGYHQMIIDTINKGDIDIKKEMFSNIFVTGGNTLFSNFPERLQRQLIMTGPPNIKVKVITHPSLAERRFSSWIGGSILSSLGTFHQMWFSKQEYDEHGAVLIERKCA